MEVKEEREEPSDIKEKHFIEMPEDFKVGEESLSETTEANHYFSCPQCEKTFTHKGNLRDHIKIHIGVKPYACCLCGKSFIDKGHLNDHMRIHTGEKPYACHLCGKSFTCKGSLSGHMRIHTGEKTIHMPPVWKEFHM